MTDINIAGPPIGIQHVPCVFTEMSANHYGNIGIAFRIIDEATRGGTDALKIQTSTLDTVALNSDFPDFQIREGLWCGKTSYELYEWVNTPWEWHEPLFEHARRVGIPIFSSSSDTTAVDLLENLNAPAYKIAYFEIVDLQQIRYVADTAEPMILSASMANAQEVKEAIDATRGGGFRALAIFHCVSGYPAPAEVCNLQSITDVVDRFGLVSGLSGHTMDNTTAIAAMVLGASIPEKHFILERNDVGNANTPVSEDVPN